MVVDFAVHQPDREDGGIPNPHFHVLCPIRPIKQDGKWGLKQHRVYELDEDGNRIRDQNGEFIFNAVPTTDWGSPETLEYWRQTWACLLYTSLLVMVFLLPAFLVNDVAMGDPFFCKYLCPQGVLEGAIPLSLALSLIHIFVTI